MAVEPLSDGEIEDGVEGLALAQCVTNLFEITHRIEDDEIAKRLSALTSGRVARMRNISSHDYDSVNWSVAKENCRKIIREITDDLVDECLTELAQNKKGETDYTESLDSER